MNPKFLSLLLLAGLFSITACSETSSVTPSSSSDSASETASSSEESSSEASSVEESSSEDSSESSSSDEYSNYTAMSIAEAREAEEGAYVKVSGYVVGINYAYGMVPTGFILVDSETSIYIYGKEASAEVQEGNYVTLVGEKAFYISSSEATNAAEFGYNGACQIQYPTILENDDGTGEVDLSCAEETTVKKIMDTDCSENITSKLYKVDAYVNKVEGSGYTNYYIDDLDNETGSYVYTMCSGSDFAWLDEYDGKICTVYVTPLNAKSSSTGCYWRFLPVRVIDENYEFDLDYATEFAVEYYAYDQFNSEYQADPVTKVITTYSNTTFGISGLTISYSSSNSDVFAFVEEDGSTVFHAYDYGTSTITISATLEGYKSYSRSIDITYSKPAVYETITVSEAIAAEVDTKVYVKGIVGPSLANQNGFYLMDDTGMIAVVMYSSDLLDDIHLGNTITLKGDRDLYTASGSEYGQICLTSCTVELNEYGYTEYPTNNFNTETSIAELYNLDYTDCTYTTKGYVITGTLVFVSSTYYSNLYIANGTDSSAEDYIQLGVYCSNAATQYGWLSEYDGDTVTMEVAPCNWNSKSYYRFAILSITDAGGNKIVNEYRLADR